MLKKPAKAIKFYSDTHDTPPSKSPLNKGGLGGGCAFYRKVGWPGRWTVRYRWSGFFSISASQIEQKLCNWLGNREQF
jgi:hypothetical protein